MIKIKAMAVVAAALVGGIAGQAQASVMSGSTTAASGAYLSNGQTFNGSFDITSAFAPGFNYTVSSATATFRFDDRNDYTSTKVIYGQYDLTGTTKTFVNQTSSGFAGTTKTSIYNINNYYDRSVTTETYNNFEQASVGIGGQKAQASSSYYDSSYTGSQNVVTSSYSAGSYKYKTGSSGFVSYYELDNNYNILRDDYFERTYGYGGEFSTSIDLDAESLKKLLTDAVTFSIAAVGSLYIQSVTLSYVYEAVPATAVPEPAAFALLGAGMAGLGFARRRKAA